MIVDKYPQSQFRGDAEKTLKQLKTEAAAAPVSH